MCSCLSCVYVQIGKSSLGNNLLKYAAKDYFFKASLCHFCLSPGNARVSGVGVCVHVHACVCHDH